MDPGNFPGNPVVKTSPSNAGGPGSILGWGDKIPHVFQPRKKKTKQTKTIKQKQYCNKFNKSFKKKETSSLLCVELFSGQSFLARPQEDRWPA